MTRDVSAALAGTLAVLIVTCLLIWAVLWGLFSFWQSGCEADGYQVVSKGYGLSKTYWCVDGKGNIVDVY